MIVGHIILRLMNVLITILLIEIIFSIFSFLISNNRDLFRITVVQPMYKYFDVVSNSSNIYTSKSC